MDFDVGHFASEFLLLDQ